MWSSALPASRASTPRSTSIAWRARQRERVGGVDAPRGRVREQVQQGDRACARTPRDGRAHGACGAKRVALRPT